MTEITFITDYVCPYCLVAKKALESVLEETGMEARITYLPFQLTKEPKPQVDTYHDEVRRAHYQILQEPCKELSLDMKIPPHVIPRPYTRLAFEGALFAEAYGKAESYSTAVYEAYFLKEKDIGDLAVLKELAMSVGLEGEAFTKALLDGTYQEEEKAKEEKTIADYTFRGVPAIFLNGEKLHLKTYTKEEMKALLASHVASTSGFCCTEDGCC